MADFQAPSGPPPPKVPEGWVARWNDQYKEWFYVNTFTKKSQWEKPTAPAVDPNDVSPGGPPPGYSAGSGPAPSDTKTNPFANDRTGGSHQDDDADARLARQLQAEEDARARGGSRGAADSYMNSSPRPSSASGSSYPEQLPARDQSGSRGLLGKIFGGSSKNKQHGYSGGGGFPGQSHLHHQQGHYGGPPPPQQQYYGGGPPPGQYGGGYGQQPYGGQYGGPPQQGYYGGGGGGYGGGYGGYQQQQPKRSGGLGTAGGAALGVGAGLIGGALIADAVDDHEDYEQQQAYDQGYDDGGGGDDFGGGDF
ncbi:hypothetical protein GGR57DRAFT_466827 [Xylariaceae sp. FL1272]|nr:hypothetical protein GGR57DRAFT_466827 [Xylariaceae sp. FL1272]